VSPEEPLVATAEEVAAYRAQFHTPSFAMPPDSYVRAFRALYGRGRHDDPNPTARAMSTDATADLFRVLLETAEVCPLPVLGDCIELLSAVVARRLHDEVGEMSVS